MQDKRRFHGKLFLLICLFTLCLLFILAQNSFKPSMRGVNMPDVGLFSRIGGRIEQRTTELRQSAHAINPYQESQLILFNSELTNLQLTEFITHLLILR